jgi:hypothetical protein
MKTAFFLIFLLSSLSSAFAVAPKTLDGYLYYERGDYAGAIPTFEESASLFTADGTFQQIYARFNLSDRAGAFDPPFVAPTQGRYTYRRIDDQTAELSFVDAGSFTHAGILRFSPANDGTGTFFDPSFNPPPNTIPSGVIARSFRLVLRTELSPLGGCSNRSFVRPGGSALTGFAISGTENRIVLVRAVGPGLAQFGITNFLRDPVLTGVGRGNDDWTSTTAEGIRRTSAALGVFALPVASKDAAVIARLRPGSYVAQASSLDPTDSGQILIEVYILP